MFGRDYMGSQQPVVNNNQPLVVLRNLDSREVDNLVFQWGNQGKQGIQGLYHNQGE